MQSPGYHPSYTTHKTNINGNKEALKFLFPLTNFDKTYYVPN